jgi:outer membrane receptor protein involved in Fe transport
MKAIRSTLIVSLILFLFSVSLLYTGTTGKIAGRVIDKSSGEPLPFANILVLGTTMGTVTDLNGDYFIINIPPGLYDVQARMMGYNNITVKNVKVEIDQTSTVNFELPLEVLKVEGVEVYGKMIIEPDVTYSKKDISGQEIERMAVSDPVEALLTSGSMVRDPGRGEIHVRGGRGGEVLYLIDGMEVRDPLVGGGLGIRVEDSEVNEMEIITGGFNAEYGNAQSGIVNLVTREGNAKAHSMKISYKNDHVFDTDSFDFWNRRTGNFMSDKATFSAGGPEPLTKYILPAVGLKVPWTVTYYISTTGDWTDTYTPFDDKSFLTTYLLWDKIRMQDRLRNVYTGNSKIACRFSSTAKLTLGYRSSFERRFDYSHVFKNIPENAYRRERSSYQTVADWNHTLSGNTFYTVAISYFHTEYHLSPGGKQPDEINHYPSTSPDPIDIVIGYPGIDGISEPHEDKFVYNGTYDWGEQFVDLNKDGFWNEGEPFVDVKQQNYHYDIGERFRDYNGDGIWTGKEPFYDYGLDNDAEIPDSGQGNGIWDQEPYTDANGNGAYDVGESYTDINANNQWDCEEFFDYNGNNTRDNVEGDQFYDYGYDQWAQWHQRYTNSLSIKGDVTSQVTKVHLMKMGFEYKRYRMKHEEIQYPWYMDETRDPLPPGPWPLRGIFRDFYTRHPITGAFYVQDKIETKGMIINAGLRFDVAYPGPEVKDVRDEDEFWVFGTEVSMSPRFGISFPITEFDKLYFSYGHFAQVPEYQYFYQDTTQFSSAVRLYGNPNLQSEKTVAYQLGVVHAFGNIMTLEMKGFYKDIRGLVDTEARGYAPFTYQLRVNKDYGSVRGVEINLSKRYSHFYSVSLDYTLMWAMGKSSSDRQGYDYDFQGIPLPLREYPLNWDQRHALTAILDLRSDPGESPRVFGLPLPDKWGINILTQFATGLPYTPAETEEGTTPLPNSERLPFTTTTDLKATKYFCLGPLRYEFLVEVKNLFDRSNTRIVHTETGLPYDSDPDDNRLGTEFDRDPRNWGPRRQMYLGVALGFGM